jgi:menaquinone-dependent protoporphyrinogen IX oxidase
MGKIGKAALGTTKLTGKAVGYSLLYTVEGAWAATKTVFRHREKIAGAAIGGAVGTGKMIRDISGHLIRDKKIEREVIEIGEQSTRYVTLKNVAEDRLNQALSDKGLLLDTLIVGGATASSYTHAANIPEDIQRAYELAYPNTAAVQSLSERIDELGVDQLTGFMSGVKGKLFEIKYVDYLNDGHLPSGYFAKIAESPTNPGWDIAVYGSDGATAEVIQAKATDSVSYVAQALKENPHIDVVTTSEVYSNLVLQGFGEDVINSSISEQALDSMLTSTVSDSSLTMDWMPSSLAIAMIAFSSYSAEGLSNYKKSRNFGDRSVRAYLCYLAGGAAAVATQTWWIGALAGIGSRVWLGSGRKRIDKLSQLRKVRKENEVLLTTMTNRYA